MLELSKKRAIFPILAASTFTISMMILGVNQLDTADDAHALTYAIPAGYTAITDPNFYNCVADELLYEFPDETIPATGLTNGQLAKIKELFCDKEFATPDEEKISNTKGLEKMTALTYITIKYNNLTSLDLSNNIALKYLHADSNQLNTIDISNNTALEVISVTDNQLTTLNTPKTTKLEEIWAGNNQLSSLDLSNNTALEVISVFNNQISDISSMVKLNNVDIHHPYSDFRGQTITANTNSKEYTLPTLFQAANSTLDIPDMATWVSSFAGELELYNANLNEDGKSITIKDLTEPARIVIKSGGWRAQGSQITVTYVESEPENSAPEPEIPVPNTGKATVNSGGADATYCIASAILIVVLGTNIHCYRKRKAHRKFEQ